MGEMDHKADEVKGRVKQAVGDLTDDDDLKREGKIDQAKAAVKESAHDAAEKIGDIADAVADKVSGDDDRA